MTEATAGLRSFVTPRVRALAVSWIALLLLMTTSLSVSYLPLGSANVALGVGIAVVKTAIVGWWFMQWRTAMTVSRATAVIAVFLLAILVTLSGLDFLTRLNEPAATQPARQITPLVSNDEARR